MSIFHANDATFDREVLEQRGTVLVELGARWCPPCRALEPVVESVARERASTLKVVAVDMDESPGICRRYGVRAAPTLMVFHDGKKLASHVGAIPRERIVALLGSALSQAE